MTSKPQGEKTQVKPTPFAECMELMVSVCGSQMQKWMEACTSNTNEVCSSCCGTQPTTKTDKMK
ncbi:hypothetical protein ACFLTK_02900 [Chloroflexota bacterium]